MKYLALIFEGFEEEEAMAPFALLRRAGADLTVASTATSVTGSHGFTLANIALINNLNINDYDVLIIPGGAHWKFLYESEMVHKIVLDFYNKNKWLCGICAAPTLYGRLGLLKGKNYTCFTSMNADFGGTYHDDGVVVDGKFITSRSVAYSLEFAYAIIKETMGKSVLDKVWERIYHEK
ncbi:MAG: DJ-1/PfpI family protein [Acholeplasmatales bacterium]|nr:DJ-1/PfpI family protein [Acholeplasmatales bacterium]